MTARFKEKKMGIFGDILSRGVEAITETAKEVAVKAAVTLTCEAAVFIGSSMKQNYIKKQKIKSDEIEKKRLESDAIKRNYSSDIKQSSYIDSNSQKLSNDAHQCKKCGIVNTVFFENGRLRCGYCNTEIIPKIQAENKVPLPVETKSSAVYEYGTPYDCKKCGIVKTVYVEHGFLRCGYCHQNLLSKNQTENKVSILIEPKSSAVYEHGTPYQCKKCGVVKTVYVKYGFQRCGYCHEEIISQNQSDVAHDSNKSIEFPKLRKEDILNIEQRKIIARVLVEWMHYAALADSRISNTEKKVITEKISEIFFQDNSALSLSNLSTLEKNELLTITKYHYSLEEIFEYIKSDPKLIKPFLRIAFQVMNSEGIINKSETAFLLRCKEEFQVSDKFLKDNGSYFVMMSKYNNT
jgi:aerobic-type carbon monoxide dehydrogenase small subunit (CoxS/CutS family)